MNSLFPHPEDTAPQTPVEIAVDVDTFSLGGPIVVGEANAATEAFSQDIDDLAQNLGVSIVLGESLQGGTVNRWHSQLPTGSLDLPRAGYGKDTAEIKRILRRDPGVPDHQTPIRGLVKSAARMALLATPTEKAQQAIMNEYLNYANPLGPERTVRADMSYLLFNHDQSTRNRIREIAHRNEADEPVNFVIEPFGLMANGFSEWTSALKNLRYNHGGFVKGSFDIAHLQEVENITPTLNANGAELLTRALDVFAEDDKLGTDAIGAFELNFFAPRGHKTPGNEELEQVAAMEAKAQELGVTPKYIIEAKAGGLQQPEERAAWVQVVKTIAEERAT